MIQVSKKSVPAKKQLPPYQIIRDSREKEGAGWKFNATSKCLGTIVEKLETGDYSLKGMEHLIMIERKSIPDLWGTLLTGKERFIKEMERARSIPSRYIVIEGSLKDVLSGCYFSKVDPSFILSSLVALEQEYGIHVIFADKRKDICQQYIRRLLERLYKIYYEKVANGRPNDIDGAAAPD